MLALIRNRPHGIWRKFSSDVLLRIRRTAEDADAWDVVDLIDDELSLRTLPF